MSRGRPTKLTPETSKAIIDAVAAGATYATASACAGVTYETFNEWMKAGEEATRKSQFSDFSEAVRKAEADCRLKASRLIVNIIDDKDAPKETRLKASIEYLKRRDRLEWGDNVRLDVGAMTDADILRLLGVAQQAAPDPASDDATP